MQSKVSKMAKINRLTQKLLGVTIFNVAILLWLNYNSDDRNVTRK